MLQEMAKRYPSILEVAMVACTGRHGGQDVVSEPLIRRGMSRVPFGVFKKQRCGELSTYGLEGGDYLPRGVVPDDDRRGSEGLFQQGSRQPFYVDADEAWASRTGPAAVDKN